MAAISIRDGLRPLHHILLSFPVALFTTAVVTDIAYLKTAQMQWSNFSAWMITGGLFFGGLLVAWALIALALGWRGADRLRRGLYALLLALMFVFGLINAFKHAQDGWSSVEAFGLFLSILTALLALAAAVVAHTDILRREAVR